MARPRDARPRWRRWHGWLGMGLGLWLALLGLSGSLLVFYPVLDAGLNPALRWTPADGCVARWQPVLDALHAAEPDRPGAWRLELPEGGCGMVHARLLKPAESAGAFFRPLLLELHPTRLQVLTRRFWGDTVMTWLYDLHYTLLLGQAGLWAVGAAGLVGLFMTVAGLRLWWPATAAQWRQAWAVKRGAARQRRTWDQHRLVGLYTAPVLLAVALTGVELAWPEWIDPLVQRWGGPQPLAMARSVPQPGAMVTLDRALAVAQARFPQAVPRWVDTPDGPEGSYRVRLQQPGEPSARFPKTFVRVDAWSGEVLAVRDARQSPPGEALLAWMHPLHNGEALGLAGRWAVLLCGLAWPWLAWSGWRRWRDRRAGGPRPRPQPRQSPHE